MNCSRYYMVSCLSAFLLTGFVCQATANMRQEVLKAAQQLKAGKASSAIATLESAVREHRSEGQNALAEGYTALGIVYEQSGDLNNAEKMYSKVKKYYAKTESFQTAKRHIVGITAAKANREGVAGIKHVLEESPNAAEACDIAMKIIYMNIGKDSVARARLAFDAYVSRFGYSKHTMKLMLALVDAYDSAGQWDVAYKYIKDLFERFPDAKREPAYLIKWGYLANLVGRGLEAQTKFDEALVLKPDERLKAEALMGKAISYRDQHDPGKARVALDEADKLARQTNYKVLSDTIGELRQGVGFDSSDESSKPGGQRGVFLLIATWITGIVVGAVVVIRVAQQLRTRRSGTSAGG